LTTPTAPAPLPEFSYDWIGGDIRGLSGFAGTLYDYAVKIDGVASGLDTQVSGLVSAAGWQGTAAQTFRTAWLKDVVAARKLSGFASAVETNVEWLAQSLASLESELEDTAHRLGVTGWVKVSADGTLTSIAETPPETDFEQIFQTSTQEATAARKQTAQEMVNDCQALTSVWNHPGIFAQMALPVIGMSGAAGVAGSLVATALSENTTAVALDAAFSSGGVDALGAAVYVVGGGAAVGAGAAAAALGIGDFINHFVGNAGADIHSDGVIGGLAADLAQSPVQTGDDFRKVWDSIF
jgi:acylphosphatase